MIIKHTTCLHYFRRLSQKITLELNYYWCLITEKPLLCRPSLDHLVQSSSTRSGSSLTLILVFSCVQIPSFTSKQTFSTITSSSSSSSSFSMYCSPIKLILLRCSSSSSKNSPVSASGSGGEMLLLLMHESSSDLD